MTIYGYGASTTAIREDDIRPRPHAVDGRQELTGEEVRAYLAAEGYEAEAAGLMAEARRFPGTYMYTADRHRYAVHIMPGDYWRAGDCAASEERIKSFRTARTSR